MTVLAVEGLNARHGLLHAVRDVSFAVRERETLALVGANGAGKTTLLRTIAGAHRASSGHVIMQGHDVTALPAHARVRRGIALVPEGRRLFAGLSVEENLRVAAVRRAAGGWDVDSVLQAFPMLQPLRRRQAGSLSGGEQQAAAIGRALMTNPTLLLLDEVSLGLAPKAVAGVYETLRKLREQGTAIVLVEQDLARALAFADAAICMLEGEIVLRGQAADLTREQVTEAYFGLHRQRGGPAA